MSKKKKKGFEPTEKKNSVVGDINVTPLIDIVLVLLIIYMVVTPVMINKMSVKLPEKAEDVPEDDVPDEQILVAVCEDGSFSLNREVMELNPLIDKVRKKVIRKVANGDKGVVFVDGHPEAPYEKMVKLMDAVREAGNQAELKVRIGVATLKEEEDFRACTPVEKKEAPPEPPAETIPG